MKVLGICGSPRKGANTEFALNFTLNELKELGFETEKILLAEKEVKFCNHCGKCLEGKECPIKDDAKEVFDKMVLVDAIIIASPVYYVGVSAQVKALFDRSIMIRGKLKGKLGGAIAVGQARNGGQEIVCDQIHQWMLTHEMRLVAMRFGGTLVGSMKDLEAVKRDEFGLNSCKNLAKKIAEALRSK